jgi:hypothetical protein
MRSIVCPNCGRTSEKAGDKPYCEGCGWNVDVAANSLRGAMGGMAAVAILFAVVFTVVALRHPEERRLTRCRCYGFRSVSGDSFTHPARPAAKAAVYSAAVPWYRYEASRRQTIFYENTACGRSFWASDRERWVTRKETGFFPSERGGCASNTARAGGEPCHRHPGWSISRCRIPMAPIAAAAPQDPVDLAWKVLLLRAGPTPSAWCLRWTGRRLLRE